MSWYYAVNGEQRGPVSGPEFEQKIAEGVITPNTLVWREGMADWRRWSEVRPTAGDATNPAQPPIPRFPGTTAFTDATSPGPLELKFTGRWEEYFRIWIVNVLLTIVTLGIYAAWAKVRKKRYFYAHTTLAGHAFEYLADPKKILIGNLIVGVGFILYTSSTAIGPQVQLPLMLLIGVAIPWFIVRSFLFNARNSAWRGLRFGFHGRYWDSLVVNILLPALVPFTLGLLLPYVAKRRRKWMVENHRFGATAFSFDGRTGDLAKIYLKALAFFIPVIFGYFLMIALAAAAAISSKENGTTPVGIMFAPFLVLAGFPLAYVGTIFLRARLFGYHWSSTAIGPHTFRAHMRARDLLGLQLLNSLVVTLTAGILWPWAVTRTVKFQLDSIEVVPGGNLDTFVAEAQPQGSAIGEAAGDLLDFDLGFGA